MPWRSEVGRKLVVERSWVKFGAWGFSSTYMEFFCLKMAGNVKITMYMYLGNAPSCSKTDWQFWLLVTHIFNHVQCHFGIVQWICLKVASNSKTARHRVLRTDLSESETHNDCNKYIGYIWPCSVQGHFGIIRCTCLKLAWDSKRLPVEQNGLNCENASE